MENDIHLITYFQYCIYEALASENVQVQMIWLERALDVDPTQLDKVLRVATGMQNLSERTSGKAYIKKLEKLVEKPDEKKEKKKLKNP